MTWNAERRALQKVVENAVQLATSGCVSLYLFKVVTSLIPAHLHAILSYLALKMHITALALAQALRQALAPS